MKRFKVLLVACIAFVCASCFSSSVYAQAGYAKHDSTVKVSIAPKAILNTSANQLVIGKLTTEVFNNVTTVYISLDNVSTSNQSGYAPRKILFRDVLTFTTSTDFPTGVTIATIKAKLADLYGLTYQ